MAALCHKEPGVEVTLLAGLVGDEHILVTGMVHNIDTTEMVPLFGYMKLLTFQGIAGKIRSAAAKVLASNQVCVQAQ